MTPAPEGRRLPILPILVGIGVIALVATVLLTVSTGGSDPEDEFGDPTITGQPLPVLPEGAPDPAIGATAPTVQGADFAGESVTMKDDGRAKIVIFLAHWCPHCQTEVPLIQDWLDGSPLPRSVDVYSVVTSISETRDNYPPSAWLEREGWDPPVIRDDGTRSVANAFGLTAFPFWVFVDADGTVAARATGAIRPSVLDQIAAELAARAG